jgi:hypothetical protein
MVIQFAQSLIFYVAREFRIDRNGDAYRVFCKRWISPMAAAGAFTLPS